jgi:iron(II)-dependent oxidoreductase
MSGNVWEWCHSLYQPYPYRADDGRNSIDNSNNARVLRGGSWISNVFLARSAYRDVGLPDDESYNVVFRCARSLQ